MTDGQHTYRTLKMSDVRRIVGRSEAGVPGISEDRVGALAARAAVNAVGSERLFDLDGVLPALRRVAADIVADIHASVAAGNRLVDAFTRAERKHSVRWYEALEDAPVSVQEDYGFWLYLTVGPLAGVLAAGGFISGAAVDREASGPGVSAPKGPEGDFSDVEGRITARHIGASKKHDALAHRMFVTGRLSKHLSGQGEGDIPLAEVETTNYHEMYSSHILGGSVRSQPAMQAALIEALSPRTQDEARALVAGRINPVRSVVVPELLSKGEAADLVGKIVQ